METENAQNFWCDNGANSDQNPTPESDERFEKRGILTDLFHERCSLLYNDILECLSDRTEESSEASSPRSPRESVYSRHDRLKHQAETLVEHIPELTDDVKYRMQMVNKGMGQLETKRQESGGSSGDEHGTCSILNQLRKWLQVTDDRLCYIELYDFDYVSDSELTKLHKQQQALQRRIERDGSSLVQNVQKQFEATLKAKENRGENRKRVVLGSLVKRWHSLWLRSLELQCRFEEHIRLIELGLRPDIEEKSELIEPAPKRRKLNGLFKVEREENEEDTIPFAPSEYQPIMECMNEGDNAVLATSDSDVEYRNEKGQAVYNRSAMVGDNSAIEQLKEGTGPWEVIPQDVGYSSGENSIHEAVGESIMVLGPKGVPRSPSDQLNNNSEMVSDELPSLNELKNESPSLEVRKRIEGSPIKSYYKMTPLDDGGVTDTETPRPMAVSPPNESLVLYGEQTLNSDQLTESLVVQVGESEVSARTDLQEVLSLLDENEDGMDRSAFGEQLEELLNEGTTWKEFIGRRGSRGHKQSPQETPEKKVDDFDKDSCDASSELSDVDEVQTVADQPEIVVTSPVGYSTPQGTLKRRIQRKSRPNSLTNGLKTVGAMQRIPNSASETAIMSLSINSTSDWSTDQQTTPTMTQSLCATLPRPIGRSTGGRRKKLRARRMMPRSMSDGEHLSYLTLAYGNENVSPVPPLPTPSPDEEKMVSNDAMRCSFADMGGGEALVERLEGDGGSVSEYNEQSESNVWEWDDYKPPNHSENGLPDQKLDDSELTAFGDDYRLYLESRSARANVSMETGDRVPPIGLSSQESDSEVDDLYQVIRESHKQLKYAQNKLKSQRNGIENGIGMAELLATCETNVRCLQAITGHILSLGHNSHYTQQDYAAATGLLKEWQDLLFGVKHLLASCDPSFPTNEHRDNSDALLHAEIGRLSQTLKELIDQGSFNRSFTSTETYQSLDEVSEALELFQDLHARLQDERRRIRLLTRSFRSCVNTDPEIKGELGQLCEYCDKALETCGHQISQLGHLRQYWIDWQDTLTTLDQLMNGLETKLSNIEFQKSHPGKVDLVAGNTDHDLKVVYAEIQLCQDRMNRLETVCNYLMTSCQSNLDSSPTLSSDQSASSTEPEFKTEFSKFVAHLDELRERFLQIPNAIEICKCHENEAKERRHSISKMRRRKKAKEQVKKIVEASRKESIPKKYIFGISISVCIHSIVASANFW